MKRNLVSARTTREKRKRCLGWMLVFGELLVLIIAQSKSSRFRIDELLASCGMAWTSVQWDEVHVSRLDLSPRAVEHLDMPDRWSPNTYGHPTSGSGPSVWGIGHTGTRAARLYITTSGAFGLDFFPFSFGNWETKYLRLGIIPEIRLGPWYSS